MSRTTKGQAGAAQTSERRAALSEPWDVVVVGGGNAALVAAMAARATTKRVLLLERAPIEFRGGNTRHTRNIRCVHAAADAYNTGPYLYDEVWDDLCKIGTGPSNEELAALTVRESETIPPWMADHGVRWQPPLTGTLSLGRTNRFFLGGGKALVNTYYHTLAQSGIQVAYETLVTGLDIDGDRVTGLIVEHDGETHRIQAGAVVCAAGGFEANLEWLGRYWGEAAKNYVIRGPRYNDGTILQCLYDNGAAHAGEEKGFHAIAVDARSPKFDGGIATRLDTVPFSIAVNRFGQRFYDEGEEIWPKRYAIWGRNIATQPDQIAYTLWDQKVHKQFLPPMYPPSRADSIAELAADLGLDPVAVGRTVDDYNAAVKPGTFDPGTLDDCHTVGLTPPKSHWAQRIDTPPYYGIAMRPGITFTYMGVEVNRHAQVQRIDGTSFANLYAAGEIMSGNILSSGYMAGFGLTIGSVWGRIAGTRAAQGPHT
jgi:tricarballylate dehydrogenase